MSTSKLSEHFQWIIPLVISIVIGVGGWYTTTTVNDNEIKTRINAIECNYQSKETEFDLNRSQESKLNTLADGQKRLFTQWELVSHIPVLQEKNDNISQRITNQETTISQLINKQNRMETATARSDVLMEKLTEAVGVLIETTNSLKTVVIRLESRMDNIENQQRKPSNG